LGSSTWVDLSTTEALAMSWGFFRSADSLVLKVSTQCRLRVIRDRVERVAGPRLCPLLPSTATAYGIAADGILDSRESRLGG